MLSTNELAWMREAIDDLLPDTCEIMDKTETNTNGVLTVSYAGNDTEYDCRLDAKKHIVPKNTEGTGAVKFYFTYILTLPYNAIVTEANHILHDSIEYAIISIDEDKSWAISRRLTLERVHG